MTTNQERTRPTVNYSINADFARFVRDTAKNNGVSRSLLVERMIGFFMRNPMLLMNILVVNVEHENGSDSTPEGKVAA